MRRSAEFEAKRRSTGGTRLASREMILRELGNFFFLNENEMKRRKRKRNFKEDQRYS